jgi:putative ABC transport system permease protein
MSVLPETRLRGHAVGLRLPLELRLALRDLRGGLSGFTIFLICIALGTGAIGTIAGLSDAIQDSISRQGKELLGGDVEATLVHRRADDKERAFFASYGDVSEVATMRAMARKPDGSAQALVDLKAIDGAYPLYGAVTFEEGQSLASIQPGDGAAVDRSILDQLQIGLGDSIAIGRSALPVKAIIEHEPDRLTGGPAFGARVLLSVESLKKSGLVEPGSLVRWNYRIKTREPIPASFKENLAAEFPEAGFLMRDSSDPSPGVRNMLQRLTEFLTLTGLTAMLTGGIGVANAVAGFVERRRLTIATFKSLGASQRVIFRIFMLEVGLLALIGIGLGFVIAAAAPSAIVTVMNGALPLDIETGPRGRGLALAALFGLLSALPFILWPIGRAQQVRAAELFRGDGGERSGLPPRRYLAASFAAAGLLALAAIGLSQEHRIAAITSAAVLAVFALFWGAGIGIRRLAASIKRPKRPEVALALANIAGPASLARTVALSLGTGLTLLTAVSLVDASLTDELKSRLPEHAPSYFFIGVPKQDLTDFEGLLNRSAPGLAIASAPMLRGRLVALRGVPVEQLKVPSSAEWVLNGDRGITYSETLPEGSRVEAGAWWAPGYEGEPLVSFEADIAKALGLKLGDAVTVNVIGRNLTARIANFRKVKWGTMGINFVMIFSPNALRKAPFTYLATLSWPEGQTPSAMAESGTLKAVAAAYPTVSAIRVKDALDAINGVFEKVMRAVRIAGSLTLVMGALVVAGALIAAQRRRIYEAVVLRALGASRRRIIAAHLLEYVMLALSLSAIAAGLGALAAYAVVTFIMSLAFVPSASALLQPSLVETIFVVLLGAVGTSRVLSAKPAYYLRSE